MKLYKTPTRSISIQDDELIFTTWVGLWSMIGLMCSIIGATMTMINAINNELISFWYIFFILLLILGVNLLFGRKKVIINKNINVVTRTVKTLLFKFTKQIDINKFDKIHVYHDQSSYSYTHNNGSTLTRENNARTVSLVKMNRKYNFHSSSIELAEFYDNEGYKVFTKALAAHIGWELPSTMILGNEEVPVSFN